MSSPHPPFVPTPDDDDRADESVAPVPTMEEDGDRVLDPDADQDAVDSARADRVATGADDDEEDLL